MEKTNSGYKQARYKQQTPYSAVLETHYVGEKYKHWSALLLMGRYNALVPALVANRLHMLLAVLEKEQDFG